MPEEQGKFSTARTFSKQGYNNKGADQTAPLLTGKNRFSHDVVHFMTENI